MAPEGIYVTNWASVLGWRGLQGCSPKISFCPFSPFVSPRERKTGCSNKARFGKHRQDVIMWSMSGSCLSLCLSLCYCVFFFLMIIIIFPLWTLAWHLGLIGTSRCKLVMSVNDMKRTSRICARRVLMIAGVCFTQRRARQGTQRGQTVVHFEVY